MSFRKPLIAVLLSVALSVPLSLISAGNTELDGSFFDINRFWISQAAVGLPGLCREDGK